MTRGKILGSSRERLRKLENALLPVAVILLSIPASWQLLGPGFFSSHDSILHLLRMVELDEALRSGDLFPRWWQDFALGYGYPLLNYYPPLSYYFGQFFHILGLGFGDSLKAVLITGMVLSGLGMYLFTKDLFHSRPAALLSSVAFMYFPYHLTDVYVRGAIPEATSIVFLPFALWAFHRLAITARLEYAGLGALFLSGLVLAHVISIFFLPILAGYSLAIIFFLPVPKKKRVLLLCGGALALGLALSAFYWLPVLLEKQYATVVTGDWVVDHNIRENLLAPENLVQLSPFYDYQVKFPPRLALGDLVLALAGLGLWLTGKNRRQLLPALAVLLSTLPVLIFLLSEASLEIWRQTPLIGLVQFPWRLLAFVGLATSVLTGLLAQRGRLSYPIVALVSLAIISANVAELSLDRLEYQDSSLSVGTNARFEYDTGVIGTAYANEWLPSTAKPGFTSPLYDSYPPPVSENGADVVFTDFRREGPLTFSASVVSPMPTRIRLHSFFFPGWQAKVDGRKVETYPSTGLGLSTFDVPAGRHSISISFEDTLPRAIGKGLSVAGLVVLLVLCFAAVRRAKPLARYALGSFSLLLVGLVLLTTIASGGPAPVKKSTSADFAGYLRLIGFEFDTGSFARNGRVGVTLYWQTLRTMEDDLKMSLEAYDSRGSLVGRQLGAPIYSTAHTSSWSQNEIVRDRREVRLLPEMSPGPVSLRLVVGNEETLLGSTELGIISLPSPLSIKLPAHPSPLGTKDHRLNANFEDKILLLGYDLRNGDNSQTRGILNELRPSLLQDGMLRVSLFWRALANIDQDYVVSLRLVGSDGELQAYDESQPQMGLRQTSLWQPGETIEDVHYLKIPSSVGTGMYKLEISLYQFGTEVKFWPKGGQSAKVILDLVLKGKDWESSGGTE